MSLTKWRKKNGSRPVLPTLTGWVDSFFGDDDEFFNVWRNRWNKKLTIPAVNINDSKDTIDLEVAVPGMKREDFKVKVENGVLNISAEVKSEKEEEEEGYSRKEFNYESFSRSFWLPENVDADAIKANYKDGILKISLPKIETEETEPTKSIEIS